MRFLFLLFSACIVTALHAVTVTWTVPNSQYKWLSRTTSGTKLIDTDKVGIYFVYTSSPLASDKVGDIAPTTAGSRPTLSDDVTISDTAAFANAANDDGKIGARATFKNLSGDAVASKGYFYMVVFSKENKNENLYMVAGGSQYVADKTTGIYDSTVSGKDPTGADYVDVSIVGGTWTAAKTPEPTTFALLALGMAGLALRRRVQR